MGAPAVILAFEEAARIRDRDPCGTPVTENSLSPMRATIRRYRRGF